MLTNAQQIGNVPSNLRIVDYSLTGSAHDSAAFQHTAAARYPDWLFHGQEFAWVDSAYALTIRTIPVHKEPASRVHQNAMFDKAVSRLRVRSEHCMGALKGRFQCLRGLRVKINNHKDHHAALQWITVTIILHNLIIDIEGSEGIRTEWEDGNATGDRQGASGSHDEEGEGEDENEDDPAVQKRNQLIAELLWAKHGDQLL
jgi:hypothetical protein